MSETRSSTWDNFNQDLINQFRVNSGAIPSGQFKGRALLLLSTTGAKSGKRFTSPLAFTRDGERYVVIASKGGAPTNPDWYHNLVANPRVTVEVGSETFEANASVAQGDERQRLWDAQVTLMPGFAEYQTQTTRILPVIVLERAS